ncbi:alkaline phosphatase family protein [Demequina sp.]|uniref:alkaline phosphatase family protein n=1 Tax=Demequina sp. TaxID=2050685 RepID=UPI003D0EDA4E
MTDPAHLEDAGLVSPQLDGAHLGLLIPAALDALGVHIPEANATAARVQIPVPDARHVIVVLLDGLGHYQLDARKGHAPFLRGAESAILSAAFPTTTATSLALLGTGKAAGRTGMTGYTVRNPQTGELANLVSWEGAPSPDEWQREPRLMGAATKAGVEVTTLGKPRFHGSGLTRAVLEGGTFVGVPHLHDGVDAAISAAARPGMTYLYWSEIDAAGHAHGWQSNEWVAALEEADGQLARLARGIPDGAVMLVTADHGMVDVVGAPRWNVATNPALSHGVEIVAGEPRALHVHVAPGIDAAEVAARWEAELGDHAVVGTRDQWIGAGVFGDVAPHVTARIGDVVVAMTGCATVVDSRTQTAASLQLAGMHGSLTPDELYVPLLIVA